MDEQTPSATNTDNESVVDQPVDLERSWPDTGVTDDVSPKEPAAGATMVNELPKEPDAGIYNLNPPELDILESEMAMQGVLSEWQPSIRAYVKDAAQVISSEYAAVLPEVALERLASAEDSVFVLSSGAYPAFMEAWQGLAESHTAKTKAEAQASGMLHFHGRIISLNDCSTAWQELLEHLDDTARQQLIEQLAGDAPEGDRERIASTAYQKTLLQSNALHELIHLVQGERVPSGAREMLARYYQTIMMAKHKFANVASPDDAKCADFCHTRLVAVYGQEAVDRYNFGTLEEPYTDNPDAPFDYMGIDNILARAAPGFLPDYFTAS